MKKALILLITLILLSCKNKAENPYFSSDEVYYKVLEARQIIKDKISKDDSYFYIINRYDTLIIMSTKYANVIKPTYTIKKEGFFKVDNDIIIVTQPYKEKFPLLKKDNALIKIDNEKEILVGPNDSNYYQKGVIYIMENPSRLKLISEGDLRKYFHHLSKVYDIKAPPPPPEMKP